MLLNGAVTRVSAAAEAEAGEVDADVAAADEELGAAAVSLDVRLSRSKPPANAADEKTSELAIRRVNFFGKWLNIRRILYFTHGNCIDLM